MRDEDKNATKRLYSPLLAGSMSASKKRRMFEEYSLITKHHSQTEYDVAESMRRTPLWKRQNICGCPIKYPCVCIEWYTVQGLMFIYAYTDGRALKAEWLAAFPSFSKNILFVKNVCLVYNVVKSI